MPQRKEATLLPNDYTCDNMILYPDDVTKIIGVPDWGTCRIGDPLSGLGTALAYLVDAKDSSDLQQVRWNPSNYPGPLTRAQLVERYALATGRDISSMAFYLAFARFKVAVILQQIDLVAP